MPSWLGEQERRALSRGDARLMEWEAALGDLLARAAPFFDTAFVRGEFLAPFMTEDEEGLGVLAAFADMTVRRHVMDASEIPVNTLELLDECATRVIGDGTFKSRRRGGEVYGHDLPELIRALLFAAAEKNAPRAARFANGDWSEIGIVMPLVTRLMTAVGWSPYVMGRFLALCERVGTAYPVEAFAAQVNAVLGPRMRRKGGWIGSTLPARTAGMVQGLAEAHYPLEAHTAQELLIVLDRLIDLGDRRSAALEQAELFRGVQMH
jgi:hypothetical protein